jgi:hypothetical protein
MAYTTKNTQQLLAEFWFSGGLAAIFARLECTGLLCLKRLQGKIQAKPH